MDLRTNEERHQEELEAFCLKDNETFCFAILRDDIPKELQPIAELIDAMFGRDHHVAVRGPMDMFEVLVEIGAFRSKSDARKNWKKTDKDVPEGLTAFVIGKKKTILWVWRMPDEIEAIA